MPTNAKSGLAAMGILIRKLEGFGPLSVENKALILGLGERERKVETGTDVITEGEVPTDVHLITAGLASL